MATILGSSSFQTKQTKAEILCYYAITEQQNLCACLFISDRECNPSLLSLVANISTTPSPTDHTHGTVQWWDAQGIVGLIIFLFCTLYAR